MTTPKLGNGSLMLSVVLWGTLLGGIAYSHLVYFPAYLSALPDSAVVVNGPYGLHQGIFCVLVHPLLTLSLIFSLVMNWKLRERRRLILFSLAVYILVQVATAVYFVP